MSRFPTAGHLSSWAGVCPGNNESAGKRRSGRLIAIYYMIKEDKEFVNLESDFYNKFNKEKKANAYIKKLKELGYDVQLDSAQVS